MTNSSQFLSAAEIVKNLKTKPDNNELLILYGLYKQATVGDNDNEEPGFLDFKGKEKHKAWLKNKGMSTYDSEVKYITKVNELITKYGINQ
jgi:diazepam-binding inhibitor (GABA receptor modulating acyl-CoA-binding protein)